MTDSQINSILQAGSVFTVQSGQRIPCAPSTSWGSSPSERDYALADMRAFFRGRKKDAELSAWYQLRDAKILEADNYSPR